MTTLRCLPDGRLSAFLFVSLLASGWPSGGHARSVGELREERVVDALAIGDSRWEISRWTDRRPAQAILAETRARWASRPAPVMAESSGHWRSLTQVDGDWIETLAVHAVPAGSEGVRVRVRVNGGHETRALRWLDRLVPAGALRVGAFDHLDGNQRVATVVYRVPLPALPAWHAVRDAAAGAGFAPRDARMQPAVGAAGAVLSGPGGQELVVMVPDADGASQVVFHWRRR
jgi:hypothetical protein